MNKTHILIVLLISGYFCAENAFSQIVTFDDVPFSALPYSESGLTFTKTAGSPGSAGGAGDGDLGAGTNDIPIRITVTSDQPFTLQTLDVEGIFRTWTIESSLGGVVSPAGTGQIDFTLLSGWTGISSFEIIHDPAEANGFIRIDNISFTTAPDPLTGDVNLDGVIDFSDIPSFIAILQSGDFQAEADCDQNGEVNFADIPAFIAILVAQ